MSTDPYLPVRAEILSVKQETRSPDLDIKTYRLRLAQGAELDFRPGQFIELAVDGVGEAPFGFASSPLEKDFIEVTVKRTGLVTDALHRLSAGDFVWVRGPFGNTFPLGEMQGSHIMFIAGGLGLAPLRPLIKCVLHPGFRGQYGRVDMLIAARTPGDFVYYDQYDDWAKEPDTRISLTIDRPVDGWTGLVGFPHNLIADMDLAFDSTIFILCGPPLMIKAVSDRLQQKGCPKDRLITTMEMRMTCGIGKCGRCNIGHRYVCVDGPVFSLAELGEMPDEY
ncbi:MAG: FAD/NAD(P)-binding protein [Clostridia bacterium]|nr:FAD/NAD(P)-binding protein [Clostridia bacterium]